MEARSKRLGLQHGNSVGISGRANLRLARHACPFDERCVLVEGTSMSCQTKICSTRNAGDWDADVAEVDRTVLTDGHSQTQRLLFRTVFAVAYREPMKHIAK